MARPRTVRLPDGSEVAGTELTFRSGGEEWNEYLLEDGTVLKFKAVVTEVIRVDGQRDQQGNPIYMINSANVVATSVPEELRDNGGERP